MNDFAAALIAQSDTWSSAYVEFVTGRHREGFDCYAFVEDDPDKDFYHYALASERSIGYLSCGGKTGVVAVYQKLADEGLASGNLFFVDRDTEQEPFEFGEEILRTTGYSWESHFCDPDVVRRCFEIRSLPIMNRDQASNAAEMWKASCQAFQVHLAWHTALCRTSLVCGQSLGMGATVITVDAVRDGEQLTVRQAEPSWLPGKLAACEALGIPREDIESRFERYRTLDLCFFARGKTVFQVLRVFVASHAKQMGVALRGELNAARHWFVIISPLLPQFDYIREYAAKRGLAY